jgi:hypothetical protein
LHEFFSYYLPVAFPLLGLTLGIVYLGVHTLVIAAKMIFVLLAGKWGGSPFLIPGRSGACDKGVGVREERAALWLRILQNCIRPLKRMALTIPLTALLIFELNALGVFNFFPLRGEVLGLPSCSTACLLAWLANTTMGLASLAACYQEGALSLLQAVKTILWGGLLTAPVFLIRFSATYYLGVYGLKLGAKVGLTSFAISSSVYAFCLVVAAYWG